MSGPTIVRGVAHAPDSSDISYFPNCTLDLRAGKLECEKLDTSLDISCDNSSPQECRIGNFTITNENDSAYLLLDLPDIMMKVEAASNSTTGFVVANVVFKDGYYADGEKKKSALMQFFNPAEYETWKNERSDYIESATAYGFEQGQNTVGQRQVSGDVAKIVNSPQTFLAWSKTDQVFVATVFSIGELKSYIEGIRNSRDARDIEIVQLVNYEKTSNVNIITADSWSELEFYADYLAETQKDEIVTDVAMKENEKWKCREHITLLVNPIGWGWPNNKYYHDKAVNVTLDQEFRADAKKALLPSSSRDEINGGGVQFGASIYPWQPYVGIGAVTSFSHSGDIFFWDAFLRGEADLPLNAGPVSFSIIPFLGMGFLYFNGETRDAQRYFNPHDVSATTGLFTAGAEMPVDAWQISKKYKLSVGPFGRFNYSFGGALDQTHYDINTLGDQWYGSAGIQVSLTGSNKEAQLTGITVDNDLVPVEKELTVNSSTKEAFEFIPVAIKRRIARMAKETETFESGSDQPKSILVSDMGGMDIVIREEDKDNTSLAVNPAVYAEANEIEEYIKYMEDMNLSDVEYEVVLEANADMQGKQSANHDLTVRRNQKLEAPLLAELKRRGINVDNVKIVPYAQGESEPFGYESKTGCSNGADIIKGILEGRGITTTPIITGGKNTEPRGSPFFDSRGNKASGGYQNDAVKNGGYGCVSIGRKSYLVNFQDIRRINIAVSAKTFPEFETAGAAIPQTTERITVGETNLYKLTMTEGFQNKGSLLSKADLSNLIGAVEQFLDGEKSLTVVVALAPGERSEDKIQKMAKWIDAGAGFRANTDKITTVYVSNPNIKEDAIILAVAPHADTSFKNEAIRRAWSNMLTL